MAKIKRIERYVICGVDTGMVYRSEYDTSCHTTRLAADVALRTLSTHVTHEKLRIAHLKE